MQYIKIILSTWRTKMMKLNDGFLLPSNKHIKKKANLIIDKYNVPICFNQKNEKIFRNNQILLSITKKYVFLRTITDDSALQKDLSRILSAEEEFTI